MTAVDTTPRGTKAEILRELASHTHPRLALGDTAHRFHLPIDDLMAIVHAHGWPDAGAMQRAAATLDKPAPAGPGSNGASSADRQLVDVPTDDLHTDPDNPRDDVGDITELADSMVAAGMLQPIVARRTPDGKLYVVAGHRRLAAARHLSWATVPAIVRRDMRPDHILAAMLIENGHRTDLDPIEEARALRRLKAINDLSDSALSRQVGRNQVYVSSRLALLALSVEDQEAIRTGKMKLTEATAKGRMNSGRTRPGARGKESGFHLGPNHSLAEQAKSRCLRLNHKRGRTVGGMACGECWESVIRADERDHMHEASAKLHRCVLCNRDEEPV